MITALYASLLAILLFILSIRVIGLRGSPVFAFIAQGKGDEELLQRAIRAQGNFTEYVLVTCVTPSESGKLNLVKSTFDPDKAVTPSCSFAIT